MAAQRPCRFFQMGKCTKGDACIYPHVPDPNFVRQPCAQFAKGRCNRGSTCTYSHDREGNGLRSSSLLARNGTETTETSFREWRYFIPQEPRAARKLGPRLNSFCKQALKLVDGDTGVVQQVITLIAGEVGMLRVAELLDQPFEQLSNAQFTRVFDEQLLPFMKTITHKNVVASPILEGQLMTIYNFVYGHGGHRAVHLFTAVITHLSNLTLVCKDDEATPNATKSNDAKPNEAVVSAFESSLGTLSKLIEVNTTAQVHGSLVPLVENLSALLENRLSDAIEYSLRNVRKYLRRIEQRFGLGKALQDTQTPHKAAIGRPIFELAKEMPGELSEDGPRHDNDHSDIRKISILPTLEEIQSSRNEYLPVADPREWHLGGLEGLLDRCFRLLREDTVGQLRDAAKFELERLQNAQTLADEDKRGPGARTFVYESVVVTDTAFDLFGGLEFAIGFNQPKHLYSRTPSQRREWWQGSKRLGYDALICLLSSEGSVTFFVVSQERRSTSKDNEAGEVHGQLRKDYNLWSEPERAYVIARLVKQDDVRHVVEMFYNNTAQYSLVEFPGVLLPAFMPTLEAMQHMSSSLDVPFANILAPTATAENPEREIRIQPPAYATKPGFRFELSDITKDRMPLHLTPGHREDEATQALEASSTLDFAQAEALVSSLSSGFSLIQGPPGTGKSYTGVQIIKALLSNKAAGDLGPILCVTFTNHALDQQLERLIDEGVSHVVRIGGQSKSERLAGVNLRAVAQSLDLTKTEKYERWKLQKDVKEEGKDVNRILKDMANLGNPKNVENHLLTHYPEHHEQLFRGVDEDGFAKVTYHPEAVIDMWLRQAVWVRRETRPIPILHEIHVLNMTGQERRALYYSWLNEMKESLQDRLAVALSSYKGLKEKLDLIRSEIDLRVLLQANIIGITTSGLARNLDLLRRVNIKVLLCEEAGEVLEAHLLTALLPSVEHAILIGDHQQLRPHVQNYELSIESKKGEQYSLDVSLFERLVQPRGLFSHPLPFHTLEVQRRMHPTISRLIARTLYPRLQNAASVSEYPEVPSMKERLFWFHHEHQENEASDVQSASRTNGFECDMTASLVSHLVKQGIYRSNDIAVITPYLGQLRKLRKKLASSFEIVLNDRDTEDLAKEGEDDSETQTPAVVPARANIARSTLLQALRVATVDNFQGEEAKVIVVSLVRSNKANNPGFLKTPNRINVLLSRAQHGMYILGNSNTTQRVDMWCQVLQMLQNDGLVGDAFELCCPRHKTPMLVKEPDDFLRFAPEAGCNLPCSKRLNCGHSCTAKCHSDMLHQAVFCTEPCTRPKPGCSHNCPLPCGQICDKYCREVVENIDITPLGCEHRKISLPCYQVQDPSKIKCDVIELKEVLECTHKVLAPCHVDVNHRSYRCDATCGAPLPCGHLCKSKCHECRVRVDDRTTEIHHKKCTQPCDRNYSTCKHRCRAACHGDDPCPLCEAKCDVRCVHSACDKKCHEPCAPCAEGRCESRCPHAACKMPCAAPCDWLPCSLRCEERLACGCQCPSVCGEACPDVKFCQNCATEEVRSQQADVVMFEAYGDIDLNEDPCIFTDCGHVFTISSMDGIMDMPKHYDVDPVTGGHKAIKRSSEPFSSDELKTCPTCRGSLRNIARYGRIVRRALLDESAKKLTLWSQHEHQALVERLLSEQEGLLESIEGARKHKQDVHLGGSPEEQVRAVRTLKTSKRYRGILELRKAVQRFAERLEGDEQPYRRVRDLVETVRRRDAEGDATATIGAFEPDGPELQPREHLQALSLLMRTDIILLSDVVGMHGRTPATATDRGELQVDFGENRRRCEALVAEARRTANVRQEVEARTFWARFAALECKVAEREDDVANDDDDDDDYADLQPGHTTTLRTEALHHLDLARATCERRPVPTDGLNEEVEELHGRLSEKGGGQGGGEGGLSTREMRMVVRTMAREFQGTGHWYRCANGHLFTIGNCGMAMELASCSTCGAGIGGRNHVSVAGVTHADEVEREFGRLGLGR